MPPIVRLGQHGCWSGRHRQESGEGSLKFEFRSLKEHPSMLPSQGSSKAEGDQTERVISERVPASEGAARAPGMSEPRAADFRLQESDFSKQPRRKFPTQKLFAATDSPPRVWGHGCRKTVRSRSQGRRPAKKQMRDDPEFRLKSVVVRPLGRTGQASSVARRRRSVMIVRVRLERTHCTSSKRSSARSTMFRSGDSGPNRSTCLNRPWLERFEPFPVAPLVAHKHLVRSVENNSSSKRKLAKPYQDRFE